MKKMFVKITKQVTGGGLRAVLPLCLCALFTIITTSCPNSADDSYTPPAQTQQASPSSPSAPATTVPAGGTEAAPEVQYITFKGSVQEAGALPASYAKPIDDLFALAAAAAAQLEGGDQIDVARAARPDVTVAEGMDLKFFATATAREDGTVVEGVFAAIDSSDFEMSLAVGKTWDIVCGVKKISTGAVVFQDTYSKQVTAQDSVLKHDFELLPVQEGSGIVSLTINFDGDAVDKVEARWEKDYANVPALSPAVTDSSPATFSASGVPCGSYNIIFSFKDSNGISVYESVQSVTVLNGMTTDTWTVESGESAIVLVDGVPKFSVDDSLVKDKTSNWIYVGVPEDLKGQGVTANNSNKGGAYSPLETLGAAFKKIQSAGKGDKDFQIFVSGEINGNSTIISDITSSGANANAKSITIQGLVGNASDCLNGSGVGSVLTINSTVPVIIKNIKITGGSASDRGGGIRAKSGTDLTIEEGALITGNTAGTRGGGISAGGKFKMNGGEVSKNESGQFGGGLFFEAEDGSPFNVEAEISGSAVIKENTAKTNGMVSWDGMGGGVYVGGNATVTMSGGEISGNNAKRGGGGVRASGNNAKFVLKGNGKITGNTADAQGGGIDDDHIVEILGGEISGNTAPNGGAVIIGGDFTIGGSTKIPYGGSAGSNDVYVKKVEGANFYKTIQIAAGGFSYTASPTNPTAVLLPEGWHRNYAIIKAPSGGSVSSYTPYFQAVDKDFSFGKLTDDTAKLKAALCVSNKPSGVDPDDPTGAADSNDRSGTRSQPYRTIAFAVSKLDAGEPDEIIIDYYLSGIPLGPQEVPASFTTANCAALTIRGANDLDASGNPKDVLDAGYTNATFPVANGSALTIKSFVPVLLKNLVITGGYTQGSGGGVYVKADPTADGKHAIVDIGSNVIIKGNRASEGGGLYLCKKAVVGLHGTGTVIGNKNADANPDGIENAAKVAAALAAGANIATASVGGGIYADYSESDASRLCVGQRYNTVTKAFEAAEGENCDVWVCGNKSAGNGGGIYLFGELSLSDGKKLTVKRNFGNSGGGLYFAGTLEAGGSNAEYPLCIEENVAGSYGGGVFVDSGCEFTTAKGFSVTSNVANTSGGGFYNQGNLNIPNLTKLESNQANKGGGIYHCNLGSTNLKIGDVGSNSKTPFVIGGTGTKANKAVGTGAAGGAIYVVHSNAPFTMGNAASIPAGVANGDTTNENDVYLNGSATIKVQAPQLDAGSSYATITLPSWTRGKDILTAATSNVLNDTVLKQFILSKDNDDWDKGLRSGNLTAYITMPVYVTGTAESDDARKKCKAKGSSSGDGTPSSPFDSITNALSTATTAGVDIVIDGKVTGSHTVTSPSADITIRGYKAKNATESLASLDGEKQSGVKPLTVSASGKTVTITDLKIAGGNTTSNGGGINLAAGTLKLGDGVKVTGNSTTKYGGGIYVASGANLFMYGKSIVGDMTESTATSADDCANNATSGGGGIYNDGGAVYIGYSDASTKSDMDAGYGVRRNFAGETYAGGICNRKGTLKIASGSISYNQVLGGNGTAGAGGGVYNAYEEGVTTSLTIEAPQTTGKELVMYGNKAVVGGAIANNTNGVIAMSAGQIGGSGTGQQNTAISKGGAVYHAGNSFSVSGTALIYPSTTATTNDVFLPKGNETIAYCVTVGSSMGNSSTQKMPLTLDEYKRGTRIVLGDGVTVDESLWEKFYLTSDDTGWDKEKKTVGSGVSAKNYVAINSPIYVVDENDPSGSGKTRPDGFNPGVASGATGTKTSPYVSVAAALGSSDLSLAGNTITVAGTLKGAQTISGTSVPSELSLKGYKASGATSSSAKIDAGGTADAGSALTVNKSGLTVTITDLQITGGSAYDGGGIYLTAGTVTLDSGVLVFSNKAKANGTTKGRGAGVFVASGATLNIKAGSEISSNSADSGNIQGGGVCSLGTVDMTGGSVYNNSAYDGGGIYNYGTLYVRGSAIIGAQTGVKATGSTAGSTCSNSASNSGGGIYNDTSANLYFGCNAVGETPTGYSLESSAGVRRNYANYGGGIYNLGTFKSASGLISDNLASNVGGGMYAGGATNNLGGLGISNNQANWQGGGLYVASSKTATITSATGINSNTATSSTTSDVMGGGIYIAGTLTVNETLNASSNSATITGTGSGKVYGGCVYIASGGKFTFAKGKLGSSSSELNSVSNALYPAYAYGGAVYNEGTFEVKGSGFVYPGSLKSNDVYLKSGKCVTLPANSYSGGNDGTNKIALTLETWKRGTQVLDGSYAATYYNCFKCTDTEWSVGYKESAWALTDDLKKRVGADIYVAGSSGRANGISAPPTTPSERNGTKANPYSSISDGVKACWNSGLPFTINMSGKISVVKQTIPAATDTTGLASAITIAGVTGNSSDIIDSGLSSAMDNGSALTISTATPVTLKNIKITGGYSKTNGGGILVNGVKGASLTLSTGALVTKNTATKSGGGIYFAGTSDTDGTANLIMNDTAQIDGNTASGTGTNDGGGGVYLSYANLRMSGKSVIGDTTGTAAATNTSGGYSNKAQYGGGVLASTGGNVYVGYTASGTVDSSYTTAYGILHNYSSANGGGVMATSGSIVYLAYGSISKNGSYNYGGGVEIQTTCQMSMSGGEMALNSSQSGGAVSVMGTFAMSAGTIGNASSTITSPASSSSACSNYASSTSVGGGAIYAGNGSTVTVTGGTISYNYSASNAGAILASGVSDTSKSTVNLGGGTIKFNGATNGGGVYVQPNAEVKLYGSGVIDSNEASDKGGGFYVSGNSTYGRAKLLIYGAGLIGKTGNDVATTSTYGNKAANGGGIYNTGTVCIGYSAWASDTSNTPTTCSGGVRRNYSTGQGGGIYSKEGYIYLHAGEIACNYAGSSGGGVALCDSDNWAYLSMDGGSISNNQGGSSLNGGGVYADHGSITMTGGSISSNKAKYGGGVYIISDSKLYVKSGASISSNECTSSGGAVYAKTDSSGGINMYGSGSIPKDADKKNTVYLDPQSASGTNATKIRIMEDMSPANRILLEGNSSYFYKAGYTALTVGGSVNLTYNYTFFEIKNTSWCVCCDGTIQQATYLTNTNIESFTPVANTEYNFRIDSGVSSARLKSFFENLCNSDNNTSKTKVRASSTLDLSEVSLNSLGLSYIDDSKLVVQPFEMVVLPASATATQLSSGRLVKCLAGAQNLSVPPTNTTLCTEDGIVYNKAKTELILYPGSKSGTTLPTTIPNTVTTFGTYSFHANQTLRTVVIPNHVTTLGTAVFDNSKITSATVPSTITSWSDEGFTSSALETLVVNSPVIAHLAFGHCGSLTTVIIGNTVKTIKKEAFRECNALSSIMMADSGWTDDSGNSINTSTMTNQKTALTTTNLSKVLQHP